MNKWLKSILGVVGMGLTWAVIWAALSVIIGTILMSLTDYSLETHIDPLVVMAIPGLIFGMIFFTVIRFVERRQRFYEFSLSKLAASGAVVGLLLGILSFALGTPNERYSLWLVFVMIVGSTTLLSVVSAIVSSLLFRFAAHSKKR